MQAAEQLGAIRFAEQVLQLLDGARVTATYKYAVLIALLDLCLEHTEASGHAPTSVTTRQLAEKVIELYWNHTVPYVGPKGSSLLKQNTTKRNRVLTLIEEFRGRHAPDASTPRWQARLHAPARYQELIHEVEWKLIQDPLPRLQTLDGSSTPIIYVLGWALDVRRRPVTAYQRGRGAGFQNIVTFVGDVGEYLIQLNTLLRPLVQREWSDMVARVNGLEQSQLDEHLFGTSRAPTGHVRRGLWDWQERRCFYCCGKILQPEAAEVDHFLPWARYADDGLDNFVLADVRCNRDKKASLAATEHLVRWVRRLDPASPDHEIAATLASQLDWERHPERNWGVARGMYLRLASDARLWVRGREFAPPDKHRIAEALGPVAPQSPAIQDSPS